MQKVGVVVGLLCLCATLVEGLQASHGTHDEGKTSMSDQDLSLLEDKYFLEWNPKASLKDNVHTAFQYFIKTTGLVDELTEEERDLYEKRVMEEESLEEKKDSTFSIGSMWNKAKKFKDGFKRAVEDQKPAVTQHMVELVNRIPGGTWKADVQSWMKNLSMHDVRILNGFVLDEKDQAELDKAFDPKAHEVQGSSLLEENETRSSFDGRTNWPKCREVISRIKDQGKCGSCWSFAASGVADGRLCIESDGKFSGKHGWISTGYIASCGNNGKDGCRGGNPGMGLNFVNSQGVPTGGLGGDRDTCVPYWGTGNALNHFNGGGKSPPCPRSCSSGTNYPRQLSQDKFYGGRAQSGMTRAHMGNFNLFKQQIQNGPIAIGFATYRDFMSYRSGVYRPRGGQKSGMHAVTAIGYGPDYVLAANSWATRWGDRGFFKMQYGCCEMVFWTMEPATISRSAFPLPGGSAPSISRRRRSPSPRPSPSPSGGGSGPLKQAQFIEHASESDVQLCIGQSSSSFQSTSGEEPPNPYGSVTSWIGIEEEPGILLDVMESFDTGAKQNIKLKSSGARRRRRGTKKKKKKSTTRRRRRRRSTTTRRRRRRRSASVRRRRRRSGGGGSPPSPRPPSPPAPRPPSPPPPSRGSRCILYFGSPG